MISFCSAHELNRNQSSGRKSDVKIDTNRKLFHVPIHIVVRGRRKTTNRFTHFPHVFNIKINFTWKLFCLPCIRVPVRVYFKSLPSQSEWKSCLISMIAPARGLSRDKRVQVGNTRERPPTPPIPSKPQRQRFIHTRIRERVYIATRTKLHFKLRHYTHILYCEHSSQSNNNNNTDRGIVRRGNKLTVSRNSSEEYYTVFVFR